MKTKTLAIGGLVAAGGGALLVGRLTGSRWAGRVVGDGYRPTGAAARAFFAGGGAPSGGRADRWHAVTVNIPPQEVSSDDQLPGPLARMADRIEVRIKPAPGDRGTEIYARLRGSVPSGPSAVKARASGEDPRQDLREALRETRSILETGEVLSPDKPPTTKPAPGGKLLGMVTSRGRGEGLI